MKQPKIFGHGPYVGTTGYANHTRDFFRGLSKYYPLKFRNYTVGKNWTGMNDEPHNGEEYLTDNDKEILHTQTFFVDGERTDKPMYTNYGEDFTHNINIILMETNHYYYYDNYQGPKIGYNVWESTRQPEGFFNKWKEFDQMWVPTQWQAECTIKQGADPEKVKVVPEGVDVSTFYPEDPQTTLDYVDGRFKFIHFGRWDYRKSTKEIIETFLKEFDSSEPVDLILSIDNPWGKELDGYETTEDRLEGFTLKDPRLKIKHFPSREDYITYLKNGHVFLSCARSEGWNLPLIEAMACGTPSIYSACSGQMEFAKNKGLPVKILGEKSTHNNTYSNFAQKDGKNTIEGNYYEPDFKDLARVMRDAFENYTNHKKRAIEEAKIIHKDFNWNRVAEIGRGTIQEFMDNYVAPPIKPNKILISYMDGPKVEILGDNFKEYLIEFINGDTNEIIHKSNITNNMWTNCNKKYYIPWVIKINGKVVDTFNLEGKKVLISLDSKSIGDTIAWTPYAVEFAKKHNCKVVLSTFHNEWFTNLKIYKDIEFIAPGSSVKCDVIYKIGWYKKDDKWEDFDKYPNQVNLIPLQQTATDILGLKYKELNYGVNFKSKKRPIKDKYICIGPRSTAGCKEWPHTYWTSLAKMLTELGYKVINISFEGFESEYVINKPKLSWKETYNYLFHSELFIGLSSGLSWFNWAMKKHTIMISGFTENDHEFTSNVTRVSSEACFPCWNNKNFVFDAGDWDWCPIWKGTDKQHICQKSIHPNKVFTEVKKLLNNKK
jgi:autotransporter strand-loop-strand O-heptosyltransferase